MTAYGTHSLQFLAEKYKKEHDIENDTLHLRLLDNTWPGMDVAVHGQWTDISSYEIADGNGYVAGTGLVIANVSVEAVSPEDTLVKIVADNASFEASGGDIPASKAAAIINSTHANDTVVAIIEFGQTYITEAGKFLYFNFANGLFEAEPLLNEIE